MADPVREKPDGRLQQRGLAGVVGAATSPSTRPTTRPTGAHTGSVA
ncbi:hypothetical protein [Geodermatophilus sp. SYSU D01036]